MPPAESHRRLSSAWYQTRLEFPSFITRKVFNSTKANGRTDRRTDGRSHSLALGGNGNHNREKDGTQSGCEFWLQRSRRGRGGSWVALSECLSVVFKTRLRRELFTDPADLVAHFADGVDPALSDDGFALFGVVAGLGRHLGGLGLIGSRSSGARLIVAAARLIQSGGDRGRTGRRHVGADSPQRLGVYRRHARRTRSRRRPVKSHATRTNLDDVARGVIMGVRGTEPPRICRRGQNMF